MKPIGLKASVKLLLVLPTITYIYLYTVWLAMKHEIVIGFVYVSLCALPTPFGHPGIMCILPNGYHKGQLLVLLL